VEGRAGGRNNRKGKGGKLEKREEGRDGGGEKERRTWKIVFWNVAGLRNKDKDFWKGLSKWEVMVLTETWVEEKEWEGIERKLPKGYIWGTKWAKREYKKGRAKGGMIMGIRKEIIEKGKEIETGREGVILGKVREGKQIWKVIGVYAERNIEGILRENVTEEGDAGILMIIGGDFNARTGGRGGGVLDGEGEYGRKTEREKHKR